MKLFPYFILLSTLTLSACDNNKTDPADDNNSSDVLTGHLDDAHPLVGRCIVCHGKNGEISLDGAPFLAGQHEDYLVTAMNEYVTGVRKHAPMKRILASFSDQDRQDIAAFFASKKLTWKASTIKRSNQVNPQKIIDDLGKRGKIVPC
ncbi:MAG: cytochrome c, partial [Gammaproteobacteria bacterium]|nr:cytochrome c [Gammaproteobacteria bacterium]